jgi:hypothetical protein
VTQTGMPSRTERSIRLAAEPVDVQLVPDPGVDSGDGVWLAIHHETHVAKESLVENRLDGGAVVRGPLRPTVKGRTRSGGAGGH